MVEVLKDKQKKLKIKKKNQISAINDRGKQIIDSNEVPKNGFNIERSDVSNENNNNNENNNK